MAVYQTIHHPPEGEFLAGTSHLRSADCPCGPDRTTKHTRTTPEGNAAYVVVEHFWHHHMTEEKPVSKINEERVAEFDRLGKNFSELKRDLEAEIGAAVRDALFSVTDGARSLARSKALNFDVVDDVIVVEWTDDGERTELFAIEVKRA